MDYRLSAIGYWLSAIGYRLSAIGYRLLAIGYRLSAIGYRLSAIGYRTPTRSADSQRAIVTTMLRLKRSRYAASEKLFAASSRILPGGVDSPVRAFKSVGGTPLFIDRARGARIQ